MRRLGRWLLNGITALSLALCVAGIVFYALGAGGARAIGTIYFRDEGVLQQDSVEGGIPWGRVGPDGYKRAAWYAGVHDGRLTIGHGQWAFTPGDRMNLRPNGWQVESWFPPIKSAWLGFGHESWKDFPEAVESRVTAPLWFITLVAGLLPAGRLYRWQRRRRRRLPGCCAQCSYDLRATPECCPECGAVPAAAKHPSR